MAKNITKQRLLSLLMVCVMLFSLFPAFGTTAMAASSGDYPAGVAYTAGARVDESVGLRGTVSISNGTGNVTGISKGNTTAQTKVLDVSGNSTLTISAAPSSSYTMDRILVSAYAQITHQDDTIDAVRDNQYFTNGSITYTIPDFSAYVKDTDKKVEIEITVYGDFTYKPEYLSNYDYMIDLSAQTVIPASGAVTITKSGLSNYFLITTTAGTPIKVHVTGETASFTNTVGKNGIATANSTGPVLLSIAGNGECHITVEDAKIINGASAYSGEDYTDSELAGMNREDYNAARSYRYSQLLTTVGPFSTGADYKFSPFRIKDTATVYLTSKGENAFVCAGSAYFGGDSCGITVTENAALVMTDASIGSVFARAGRCSAGIGAGYFNVAGYMEFDGGEVSAWCYDTPHGFCGIGNGHCADGGTPTKNYTSGIVINGGVIDARGYNQGIGSTGGPINTYVSITGGDIYAGSGWNAGGATIGYTFGNDVHTVRLGRPDQETNGYNAATKSGLTVVADNFGYGSAISGVTTVYSGNITAKSSLYGAAVGGGAVAYASSDGTKSSIVDNQLSGGGLSGSDITVYGGKFYAKAGAYDICAPFDGDPYDADIKWPVNATELPNGRKGYGAGIGGSVANDGGALSKVFAGSFDVVSSKYGAGIGGGGGYQVRNGGNGGNTWIGSLTDLTNGKILPCGFDVKSSLVGAGIGGGGSVDTNGGNGGNLYISTKTDENKIATNQRPSSYNFTIASGQFGAGVGGGGSVNGTPGSGADKLVITGGNFGITSGGSSMADAYDIGSYGANSFGAGIGGGGSLSGNGGNGPSRADLTGGYFDVYSNGYGSAIGGGGSNAGNGGGCGLVYVTAGTIKAMQTDAAAQLAEAKGIKGLGGGASNTGTSKVNDGTVIIIGGNVYTTAGTLINGANAGQHVWTRPNNDNKPTGKQDTSYVGDNWNSALPQINNPGSQDMYLESTTQAYLEITGIAVERIGQLIDEVAYSFPDATRVTGTYYDYGVKDTYVTKGADGKGAVAVWVPSGYMLQYDLNGGQENAATSYSKDDSTEYAFGSIALRFSTADYNGKTNYQASGQTKHLIDQGDTMSEANTFFDGMYAGKTYADDATKYRTLLKHADAVKAAGCADTTNYAAGEMVPVVFAGWSAEPDSRIYDVHENYYPNFITDVTFEQQDIKVYAVWGYDENGNGIADILEANVELSYDANGGQNAPAAVDSGTIGTVLPIRSEIPNRTLVNGETAIFVGWSETQTNDLVTANNYDGNTFTSVLDDLYINGGTMNFGGKTVTGKSSYKLGNDDTVLYAVWAADSNKNGVPDYLEDQYKLTYQDAASITNLHNQLPVDSNRYVSGNSVNPLAAYSSTGTHVNDAVMFLYWTEDAAKAATVYSYGARAAGTLPQQVTDVTFTDADKTVYAVWSTDLNGNGIPDVDEGQYSLTYKDKDDMATMPTDTNSYYPGDIATLDSGSAITAEGWKFAGWTADESMGGKYSTAVDWNANFVSGAIIDTAPYFDKNIETSVTFANADITVYAVWYVDINDNGIPDWLETAEYSVMYNPSKLALEAAGGSLDSSSMPFASNPSGNPEGTTIDNNGGNKYLINQKVAIDNATKPVDANGKYMFIGWSPAYWLTTVYGGSESDMVQFKNHVQFISDMENKDDFSGLNWYGTSGNPNFGHYVDEATSGRQFYDVIGGSTPGVAINWANYTVGNGMLESVTEASVDFTNNSATGDATTTPVYNPTNWAVYAVWALDANQNSIPDMFEDSFNLFYNGNGSTNNVPRNQSGLRAGDTVALAIGRESGGVVSPMTRYDSAHNNYMIFLGWTADDTVKDSYGRGDTLPKLASAVTFGSMDITVYAVWGLDTNNNGVPDVYEGDYSLTYNANGGTNAPIDSTAYHSGDEATLITGALNTTAKLDGAGKNYVFMYWTADNALKGVYTRSDNKNDLPATIPNNKITFLGSNITVYAVWGEDANNNGIADILEDDYSLTYDGNQAASGVPVDTTAYHLGDTKTLAAGTGMVHSVDPSYVFVGWTKADPTTYSSVYTYGEKALLPTLETSVTFQTTDITVHAVWSTDKNGNGTADVYESGKATLKYDANGGSGSMTDPSSPYAPGTAVTTLANTFTRSGYSFTGWNTKANGSGTVYPAGASFTITEDTTLYAQWKTTGGGGGGVTIYTLTFETNGGSKISPVSRAEGSVVQLSSYLPTKTGYTLEGWYTDENLTNKVSEVRLDRSMTVYAKWKTKSINDDGTSADLNSKDHMKYVVGYPDGTVRPNAKITRGEVATIFYRLLTAERRDEIFTSTNSFADISKNLWCNKAVSSMANGKYITGYSDGTFGVNRQITRAEFVTMAARFMNTAEANVKFSDVPNSHWAYTSISTAVANGWIAGYSDGTFKPDQYITRAEAMIVINRMLNRGVGASGVMKGYKVWPDNSSDSWYYYEIIEATNDHEYVGARPNEKWSSLQIEYSYDIVKYEHP